MDGHIHPEIFKGSKFLFRPGLKIWVGGFIFHAFHFFGVLGFLLGSMLGAVVCYRTGLQVPIILLMSLTGAATFYLLAFGAKAITGKEVIVYYHHEIAILIFCSVILKLAGWPVLPYLDITLLGIATFLAFGRIGCFSVGCCYGKPARKGVIFGHEHVKKGFTFYYENVPLLPVQLIESAFVFIMVISGTCLLLFRLPPGTFIIVYTVLYGIFRFAIEFFRGDPDRPYFHGLSGAQWTTQLVVLITVVASFLGVLPFYVWHIIIAAGLLLVSIVVFFKYSQTIHSGLVKQIAVSLKKIHQNGEVSAGIMKETPLPSVHKTKMGINFSGGKFIRENHIITHYTLSGNKRFGLSSLEAQKLATEIKNLQQHAGPYEIVEKQKSIFHIIFSENLPDPGAGTPENQ